MKIKIYTTDGGSLEIGDFDPDGLLDMVEALGDLSDPFAQFEMDDSSVFVSKRHVVRFDLDES